MVTVMDNSKFPMLKPVCSRKVENESQNMGFGKNLWNENDLKSAQDMQLMDWNMWNHHSAPWYSISNSGFSQWPQMYRCCSDWISPWCVILTYL